MFGLFSKKIQLVAPLDGTVIPMDQVPDAVFAQKTVGDGAAISEVSGDVVCAPADGTGGGLSKNRSGGVVEGGDPAGSVDSRKSHGHVPHQVVRKGPDPRQ